MTVIGFTNIGNTCFMNSALQVLLSCEGLSKLILKTNKQGKLINTYRDLIIEYNQATDKDVITPHKIKNIMGSMMIVFRGHGQQDAHEFIALFLQKIDEELKTNDKNNAELDSLLACKIRTETRSIETNKISLNYNNEVVLELQMPNHDNKTSLEERIEEFMCKERLADIHKFDVLDRDGNNIKLPNGTTQWVAEYAEKRTSIETTHKYIIIHFKRFKQIDIGRYTKKNNQISIPHTMYTTKGTYYLKSFIVQSGSLNGGHYVSFVLDNDIWKCANDSNITPVPIDSLNRLLEQSYVVCFEQR